MFITGPEVIKSVTGEKVSFDDLGGTLVHNGKSGVAHFLANDEHVALELVKQLLSYLPQNNTEDPPQVAPYDPRDRMNESLNTVVPLREDEPYDMHAVIEAVFDRDSFLEVHPYYARNAIVGFARLDGYCVGVVANQPEYMAGVLDINSSDKIARFVRLCDAFNIPIVTFVDCPGYPARRRSGALWRHSPRREDHLRLLRIDGAEDQHRHAQGYRRGLHRHELQADAQRPGLRLAHGADCRNGRARRGAHPASQRALSGQRCCCGRGGIYRRISREVLQPLPRRRHGPDRRSD